MPSTKQIIRYLHAYAGFPTKTSWLKAINAGNFATWLHLTAKAIRKHFSESDETAQGHMKNFKQGIRSTKKKDQDSITNNQKRILNLLDLLIKDMTFCVDQLAITVKF